MYANINICTDILIRVCVVVNECFMSLLFTHTCTPTQTNTYKFMWIHVRTDMYIHTCTHMHTDINMHLHVLLELKTLNQASTGTAVSREDRAGSG